MAAGRKQKNKIWRILAALLAALSLTGCGETQIATSYEDGMEALRTGDYATAEALFQIAVDIDGREAEGHRGLGIIAVRQDRCEEAADYFSMALNEIPDYKDSAAFREDILFYQAEAWHRLGQNDKAMSNYNQLLDGKNAGRAYLLRGKLYAEDGKFGQAGQDFRKAVERDGDYEVYLQIYEVYTSNNRQADGAAFLKEGIRKKPSTAEEYYELGRISYVLGEYEEAKQYLERAVREDVSGALTLLGRVYLEENDIEKARELFREGAAAEDSQGVGYNGLALCALYEEQYDEAINYIKSGMATLNGNVKEALRFNEIVAYECKLDFETAAARMDSFLKLYPDNEDALRENLFIQSRLNESYAAQPAEDSGSGLQPVENSTDAGFAQSEEMYEEQIAGPDEEGYDTGSYDEGVYDTGVYGEEAYDTGTYDEGIYDTGVYDTGVYDEGTYDAGTY